MFTHNLCHGENFLFSVSHVCGDLNIKQRRCLWSREYLLRDGHEILKLKTEMLGDLKM